MSAVINLHDPKYSKTEDYSQVDDTNTLPAAVPVADAGCFYGIAGEFAKAACAKSEADPIAVLIHELVWIGAYFGNKAVLRLGEVEAPPRLNAVTVSISGGGKGTAASPVRKLMHNYVNPLLVSMDDLPIQYKDGPMSTGEGLAWAVRDPSDTLNKDTGEPIDPGITDKRLMVLEEEFVAVLQAAKREGNTISAAIRRYWDNGSFSPMTKGNRTTSTDAHVCFVGHITYKELVKTLQETEYTNGFANRILWFCIRKPKIVEVPESIPQERMTAYAADFAQAIRFAQKTNNLGLSDESLILWKTVAKPLATQETEFAERARVQVLRLACIFALLDCTDIVSPAHLTAALHIWDYCTASVAYIFESSEDEEESKLLAAIRKHGGGMTTTEISVSVYQKNMKSADLNTLLKSLETKGKITRETRQPATGKGRSSTVFKATA